MIYGTLVASPTEMRDEQGATGIYFCFPDVSVRYDGRFKLHATLLRITGYVTSLFCLRCELITSGQALCTAQTEVFEIMPISQYVAPRMSTHLYPE
jgi:hypothetical protein